MKMYYARYNKYGISTTNRNEYYAFDSQSKRDAFVEELYNNAEAITAKEAKRDGGNDLWPVDNGRNGAVWGLPVAELLNNPNKR